MQMFYSLFSKKNGIGANHTKKNGRNLDLCALYTPCLTRSVSEKKIFRNPFFGVGDSGTRKKIFRESPITTDQRKFPPI